MTEEEAKTKWCPQARIDICCIGSACMAWRCADEIESVSLTAGVVVTRKSTTDGWCGLAGRP
jgi:hypothetical protein